MHHAPSCSIGTSGKAAHLCLDLEGGSLMPEPTVSLLTTWQNFYVIVGTGAATLTGVMFMPVTLIARAEAPRRADVAPAWSGRGDLRPHRAPAGVPVEELST